MTSLQHVAVANRPQPGLAARTVLVVEDEELVREIIVSALDDAGFVVLEAETGETALDILQSRAVTVLFTDIRFPGALDGWTLAERARSAQPGLAVIYATGFTAEAPRVVPGGVFFRKPYLPSAVLAVVERLTGADAEDGRSGA